MKLIRLYIENFGGLSGYGLEFQEGVTVIQEPNGFGKTTLAEFIRAMFYGFPRKAKTLDKSRRQKYTPWNGSKCGGNLVFEHEGKQYRVERTFGATPRGDTFALIDLSTNQKSDRFSEELGLELFRLDADSFERSTYMSQTSERMELTTDAIQAKLGDLVEDTGDINNFEKAVAALKGKRIEYALYRGSGGSVWEAQNRITALQRQLDDARNQMQSLRENDDQIRELEAALEQAEQELAQTREKLTAASEGAAVAAAKKQEQALWEECRQASDALTRLEEQYPAGLPSAQRIDEALRTAERRSLLKEQQVTGPADLEAEETANRLAARFEGRMPTAEALEARRQDWERYRNLRARLEHLDLSPAEKQRLEALAHVSERTDEELEALENQNAQLRRLREHVSLGAMPEAEQAELARLEQYFAAGIPGEEELERHRRALAKAEQLRQENARIMSAARTEEKPGKRNGWAMPALLVVLSAAAVAAGTVLLVGKSYLIGGICLGIGVLMLIGGVFAAIRQMVARELSGVSRMDRAAQAQMDEAEREAALLEETARCFVHIYSGAPAAEGIHEIRTQRQRILALREKRRTVQAKAASLEEQIRTLNASLAQALSGENYDRAILELRLARKEYQDLVQKKADTDTAREVVRLECGKLESEITAFLAGWFDAAEPETMGQLLDQLCQERDAYSRAVLRRDEWKQRKAARRQALEDCDRKLESFFRDQGLLPEEDIPAQLRVLSSDEKNFRDTVSRRAEWEEKLRLFRISNDQLLSRPLPEETDDIENLKAAERRTAEAVSSLTRRLLERRQAHWNLRRETDRIPELQDELEQWQRQKHEDQEKARMLDETVEFLQKAKDSLSTRYLDPLRSGFGRYLSRLSGERAEGVLVTPELQVRLERMGQSRELGYFSTGQADLVMLCMRFALVDALFKDVKPFVILDDPFVNLDDEKTAQALELLRELSRDRQIVYLVCNSSRTM